MTDLTPARRRLLNRIRAQGPGFVKDSSTLNWLFDNGLVAAAGLATARVNFARGTRQLRQTYAITVDGLRALGVEPSPVPAPDPGPESVITYLGRPRHANLLAPDAECYALGEYTVMPACSIFGGSVVVGYNIVDADDKPMVDGGGFEFFYTDIDEALVALAGLQEAP